jgi:hypothetical protein
MGMAFAKSRKAVGKRIRQALQPICRFRSRPQAFRFDDFGLRQSFLSINL